MTLALEPALGGTLEVDRPRPLGEKQAEQLAQRYTPGGRDMSSFAIPSVDQPAGQIIELPPGKPSAFVRVILRAHVQGLQPDRGADRREATRGVCGTNPSSWPTFRQDLRDSRQRTSRGRGLCRSAHLRTVVRQVPERPRQRWLRIRYRGINYTATEPELAARHAMPPWTHAGFKRRERAMFVSPGSSTSSY
jgi:hypothetical protein